MIKDIKIVTIEPLNGPNVFRFGGIVYEVTDSDDNVYELQVEELQDGTSVFYSPDWSVYSENLVDVIKQIKELDESYQAYVYDVENNDDDRTDYEMDMFSKRFDTEV